uniref:NADH-ubiquinone oxidoreductase chain 2 n=1 Tax=Gekko gecko TaxID=36310 RepID=G3JVY7_GEKGE|nr:NADH dehydrogenase subunit 2 [Gekko gecko]URZ95366.1 NADH dehydrogenase subunit 2 [Gekko gecko]
MSPLIWSLLITGLSTGTIITMSSYHWLLAWLGLELNTLSILPIISKSHHPRATEAATKYFLIQAMAAALIMSASTLNAWQTGHWSITNTTNTATTTMITLALLFKLGVAPMYAWYPEILQGSTLMTAMILTTWQKLAPMTLLYMISPHLPQHLILVTGLLSALAGGWSGLNQTQTRKIMAFSSIAHMGWLIIALYLSPALTTTTLLIYIIMTLTMFLAFNTMTIKTLTDMGLAWSQSPSLMTMIMISIMSLGGLPPLTGFMPKWLILNDLCQKNLIPLSVLLAMASLPSLFFYTRMAYFTVLTIPPNTTNTHFKWRFKPKSTHGLTITVTTTLMLLTLTPLMITM